MITSRQNAAVRQLRELLRSKRERDISGLFAAEGDHLCGELARGGFRITSALITGRAMEKYPQTAQALQSTFPEMQVISEELAEYISDAKAPQGIFAAAQKTSLQPDFQSAKRLVILDGVQDPANVGTILRTAEALGIDGAMLSEKCADIWSPKAMRASMGSVFRLPCISCNLEQAITSLKESGFAIYGAMLDENAQRLGSLDFPQKTAVVIGSEGAGVSKSVQECCTGALYIPITGAESLNAAAAAAIILWELSR